MAFNYDSVRTTIGQVSVSLTDTGSEKSVGGVVEVLDQHGESMFTWEGSLQNHLTPAQLTGLSDFMDALRTQAETQLLP